MCFISFLFRGSQQRIDHSLVVSGQRLNYGILQAARNNEPSWQSPRLRIADWTFIISIPAHTQNGFFLPLSNCYCNTVSVAVWLISGLQDTNE